MRMSAHPPDPDTTAAPDGVSTALLDLVLQTTTVEEHLGRLVQMAADVDPRIAGCAVTLRRRRETATVTPSNALAASVDELQYEAGQGPCLETLRSGEVIVVDDYVDEDRWAGYPSHALAQGVRSSLSVPLAVAGTTVGALNCYSLEPDVFADALVTAVQGFTAKAQASLAVVLREAEQSDVVDQLHTAMQTRSVIDQALGILMAREGCAAENAFAILRRSSQSRNVKIATIAAELVAAVSGSPPQPGRFSY